MLKEYYIDKQGQSMTPCGIFDGIQAGSCECLHCKYCTSNSIGIFGNAKNISSANPIYGLIGCAKADTNLFIGMLKHYKFVLTGRKTNIQIFIEDVSTNNSLC